MSENRDLCPSLVPQAAQLDRDGLSDCLTSDCSVIEQAVPIEHVDAPIVRRAYLKPSYRFERVFETMALACGKISPIELQCRFNRKTS